MVNRDVKHLAASTKPAAKRKRRPAGRSKREPMPGWLLLLIGLMAGLLIGAAVYFSVAGREEAEPRPAAREPAAAAQVEPARAVVDTSPVAEEAQEERFEFYHLLSKLEVVIPESEIKALQEHIAPKEDVVYIIQAGSFRRYEDADSRKAQLALLGVEADVQKVESNGADWYRVRVGPFDSSRKLNKVRNRIHAADINTMVIKIGKEG